MGIQFPNQNWSVFDITYQLSYNINIYFINNLSTFKNLENSITGNSLFAIDWNILIWRIVDVGMLVPVNVQWRIGFFSLNNSIKNIFYLLFCLISSNSYFVDMNQNFLYLIVTWALQPVEASGQSLKIRPFSE